MHTRETYALNSLWMVLEKGVRMLVGMFVGILIARYLGPESFGLLSFAIAMVALFTPLARVGLDMVLIRELARRPDERCVLLRAAFGLKLVAAIVTFFLLFMVILLWGNGIGGRRTILVLLVALSLLFQPVDILEHYFQAVVTARVSSICRMVQTALMSVIRISLILNEAKLETFALAIVLESMVFAFLLLVANWHVKGPQIIGRIKWSEGARLLKASWPMLLSGLAVVFYMRIDQVMIENMIGAEQLGYYSAALKFSELWYAVMAVFSTSLLPMVVHGVTTNVASLPNSLRKLFFFMIWINVAIAIIVTLWGDYMIRLAFGATYADAARPLVVHIWTGPFVALGLISGNWLIANSLQKLSLFRTLLGLVSNIFLNMWLIPSQGIVGAAIASLAAQVIAALLFDALFPSTRTMFLVKLKSFLSPVSVR